MKPDRRDRAWNVENHPDSSGLHLVQDLVEPRKFKLALRWFERIPGEIAHAHDVEPRALHDGDVLIDLLGRAINGLITRAYKKLARAWPVGMCRSVLCQTGGTQDTHYQEKERELIG